ncbi:MAG: GNAT family N-acetyltransferase [Verrucomicrobia bacterium]|nr:GNAT family N-acetyltransferase [Verrucomicrobiota bacterium]
MKESADIRIETATESDVPLIVSLIKELAAYERLSDEVVMTEELLRTSLFGKCPSAEVIIGHYKETPVGFAVFFHNFSTFLGRRGLYLEDLFVRQEARGKGVGRALLLYLARLAKERQCGRFEWAVLDWNEPATNFYKSLGATPMNEWTIFRLTGDALDRLAARETISPS